MTYIQEEWKPVVGFPQYEVSSRGSVRNRQRRKLLKSHCNHGGYPMVCIYNDGVGVTTAVHRIVALAHLGLRPDGLTINHKDGNKLNNNVENLEYVTSRANREHAIEHGLWGFGEKNGLAKLTEDDVRTIRSLHGTIPLYRIAQQFDVTRQNVSSIVKRKTWGHIL